MQQFKIIGAGVFALFAIGSLFSLLGGGPGSGNASSMALRIGAMILFAGLAVFLWKSGNTRTPPR